MLTKMNIDDVSSESTFRSVAKRNGFSDDSIEKAIGEIRKFNTEDLSNVFGGADEETSTLPVRPCPLPTTNSS